MINKYVMLAILSGILSAVSQIMLKIGSNCYVKKQNRSFFLEYCNPFVIGGYLLVFVCMLLMIYAYRGIPYKLGLVLETLVYLYVMILSRVFFSEKITMRRLLGNALICIGVIIFNL